MKTGKLGIIALSMVVSSCGNHENQFDASGAFEVEETIISAEATGVLLAFNVEEGQVLKTDDVIGFVDSTQLYLQKKQLQEQIASMLSKRPNVSLQLGGMQTQLSTAKREKLRIEKLVAGNAATSKQLDDVNAQILTLESQIAALRSSLSITSDGITNDANSMTIQITQIENQLKKYRLVSPMNGTILTTYVRKNEMISMGKPLYKIADLSEMILRVYITGDQFPTVKLNQNVTVFTDDGKGGFNETSGSIAWISDKGEFTPKTIQTKDERANMVYAIKIKVKNDGFFKIGMYGEIQFK
jgi:HlyD family secretion protein